MVKRVLCVYGVAFGDGDGVIDIWLVCASPYHHRSLGSLLRPDSVTVVVMVMVMMVMVMVMVFLLLLFLLLR